MSDTLENEFTSHFVTKVTKYPKGGQVHRFEWFKEEDRDKWKNDGYKWGKKRYLKKLSKKITESCYYVYTYANCCSKSFVREVFQSSEFPNRVIIHYKGDCKKALSFAQSISKSSNSVKELYIKNLPLSSTEDFILSLHPNIKRIKLDTSKDSSNKKYALISFADTSSCKEARELLNYRLIDGCTVTADFLTQHLPVSCIQNNKCLSSSQDLSTLFVTGFGGEVTKEQVSELFPTCSIISFGGCRGQGCVVEEDDEKAQSFRYCYVRYNDEAEAGRVHALEQDREDMVVMFANC